MVPGASRSGAGGTDRLRRRRSRRSPNSRIRSKPCRTRRRLRSRRRPRPQRPGRSRSSRPPHRRSPSRKLPARPSKPSNSGAPAGFPRTPCKALIYSKRGDVYNEDALHRDFMALWNTGRFDDIRLETEPGRDRLDRPLRRHRAARRPLHQVRGHQVGHGVRDSGPLQGAQGRPDRGIAVRPQQDPARRRGAQGIPRRARPAVRHRGARDPADPALLAEGHLQGERKGRRSRSARSTSSATQSFSDRRIDPRR